ncbi:MAG: hypothetical protein A2149_02300 [Candidatus Schekmanbacteria bacterium RBG_16_38_11]|uniref:Uncharacterized protein n=1 Tax=Candidatus Schekmanbacteria bacterium RBG_16_38_11 TaxID=1817880 RepID=A0A1F7RXT7_9BACT|nr:MAG: hypothetical protein A2149_02300 [Candidatus Schekmanbacteria bacterium RBG_16_38_11]
MDIGIAYDTKKEDLRVPLSPGAVNTLVKNGHPVYLLKGAGESSDFRDEDYIKKGAKIVYSEEELYQRGKLIVTVTPPPVETIPLINSESILMSFLHLAAASEKYLNELLKKKITAIGYEVITDTSGEFPVLSSTSEIAGSLSIQIAAHYLQTNLGGKGILLGGAPGIQPARILIIGAGSVGRAAARAASALGATVLIVDRDVKKLRLVEQHFRERVATGFSSAHSLAEWAKDADVVIGAVYIKGAKTPVVISEEVVASMKKKSLIIDLAIDQGGCVATSRPTTLKSPAYEYKGVIHYCVPNITSLVAHSSSLSLSHVLFPYVLEIADRGENFLKAIPDLAAGTYIHKGKITMKVLADFFKKEYSPIESIL